MSRVRRNLQLLWRSERTMAEARLKLTSHKLILAVIAGMACLIAVGMLNLAAYLALITGSSTSQVELRRSPRGAAIR